MQKNCVKSYSPTLNAFFSKLFFSHIRKIFVTSTCDFLLIFGDCATLMGRSVLSRGFLKSAFFGPVTMAQDVLTYLGTPTYFFNILYSKQSLHWLYSACKVWKSLGSLFLRYPFWKDFGTVVFGLKFRHFEFFHCKKHVFLDTKVHIHCFTLQKNLLWLSKESFLWLVQNECFI